jgi:nitrite reductase/ring-hydroxylating ferredoxin subunit/uncharacterized membrane protein
MRSRAHLKGHPLHPILVGFPIAFFVGTLLFDLAAMIHDNNFWLMLTASQIQICGVVFGLLAAIPGIIDYLSVVPPKSSAKKRGAIHGLLNTLVLIIFALLWFYKRHGDPNAWLVIAGETIGVIIMSVSGWMGGTLVHRNQIGIDHRYANAGKWKEVNLGTCSGETKIPGATDLGVDQMMLVHVNGRRIVIGRTFEGMRAFDDFCSHRGASLADGTMICGVVQCPWHGSQFDCTTGAVKSGPATLPIRTYELKEKDGQYFIGL